MSNLQQRQEKIQAKRKQTNFKDFVREICSWTPLVLHKLDGKISRYSGERLMNIVDFNNYNFNETKDLISYSGDFFKSYSSLLQCEELPRLLIVGQNENAQYGDTIYAAKNIYLSFVAVYDVENILYSFHVKTGAKDVIGSFMVWDGCSTVYNSANIISSSSVFYSRNIYNCHNIWFSVNCIGCHDCLLCDGLENQSYCIYNKQYNLEEYNLYKTEILSKKPSFDQFYENISVYKSINISSNSTVGGFNVKSKDIDNGYMTYQVFNGRNLILVGGGDGDLNMYDSFCCGGNKSNDCFAVNNVGNGEHIYCCSDIESCMNIYYCCYCINCSYCLGCVGLQNKSYCILNKQYTKEERYEKVDVIFAQMEKDGQLGEFFPASMNPFYFNDTAAYLIDPSFTKEEVTKLGYLRRDEPIKVDIPEGAITVNSSELGQFESRKDLSSGGGTTKEPGQQKNSGNLNGLDSSFHSEGPQWTLDETVCKRVIIDENGDAYRIIPMELEFLQKHGLPLPRKHRLTRMKENFRIN